MIELLVVTTIVILLSTIGLVSYRQANIGARNNKRKADLETVRQALVLYRADNGTYPPSGGGSAHERYNAMLVVIDDYLSTDIDPGDPEGTGIQDPQNDDPYVYEYWSSGAAFSLAGYLEPSQDYYLLQNP